MKKKAVSGGRRAYILTMRILMGAAAIITAALVLPWTRPEAACISPISWFRKRFRRWRKRLTV